MRSVRSISLTVAFCAVAFCAVALYAVTLGGTFVYDDVAVVQQDRRLADPRDWGQYWTDSYNFGVDNLYRPLVSMTYAIEHWLHTDVAWPYHAVNVLLHAVASVMVAWVAMRLTCGTGILACDEGGRGYMSSSASPTQAGMPVPRSGAGMPVPLMAGLLFAAHPVHVEAVANIVGRAELMCAIATLTAIGFAIGPLTRKGVLAIWLCCAIAILCKEQGLLAALMVGVVRYFSLSPWEQAGVRADDASSDDEACEDKEHSPPSPQPSPRGRGGQKGPLLFALLMANVAAIVFVRENVIGLKFWWDRKFLDPWIQPLSDSVGVDRWLAPFTIAGRYFGLLVAPVTLRIDYGGPIVPGVVEPRDPFLWLGVAAVVLWLAIVGIAWWRRDRLVVVCALLFAIAYAPVSNWPTIIGVNVAERLIYLPSAFFVLLVAVLLARLPKRLMTSVVTIALVLFSLRTVTYAWRWNDRMRFYEYAARVEPRSMKSILLVMEEQAERKEFSEAEAWGRRAVALDPNYDDAWLRLAGVLLDQGKLDEAEAAIARAKAIRMSNGVAAYERKLRERRAAP